MAYLTGQVECPSVARDIALRSGIMADVLAVQRNAVYAETCHSGGGLKVSERLHPGMSYEDHQLRAWIIGDDKARGSLNRCGLNAAAP